MLQENTASFWNFFVDEKYRKNGYGKKALLDVITKLKAEGIAKLWLYVDMANDIALNLYKLRKTKQASNGAAQSSRFAETVKWMESNEEKRRLGTVTPAAKTAKVKSFSRSKRAVIRRAGALNRLETHLLNNKELDDKSVARIKKEIQILKNRI